MKEIAPPPCSASAPQIAIMTALRPPPSPSPPLPAQDPSARVRVLRAVFCPIIRVPGGSVLRSGWPGLHSLEWNISHLKSGHWSLRQERGRPLNQVALDDATNAPLSESQGAGRYPNARRAMEATLCSTEQGLALPVQALGLQQVSFWEVSSMQCHFCYCLFPRTPLNSSCVSILFSSPFPQDSPSSQSTVTQ